MTGGNRGIGLFVLKKLLKCDMIVMLGVRNPEGARKQVEEALDTELTEGKVFYEKCDTGDMESVKGFAAKVQAKFPAIHVLINNGKNDLSMFNLELTLICYFFFSRNYVHAIQRDERWI
jgi:NAD(P)-dependent dehydrogenase (short-subunit alcohol dehydrogenase family)